MTRRVLWRCWHVPGYGRSMPLCVLVPLRSIPKLFLGHRNLSASMNGAYGAAVITVEWEDAHYYTHL